MITPPQNSAMADRVANQSWQLLKPHLDLHLSRLKSVQTHSLAAEVTLKNQSVSHLFTQLLPDILTSINEKPQELISSVKANQVVLSYINTTMQNALSLKSIYMIENISRYIPLISKLHSLQVPVFRSSEDMFFLQPNVVIASFPFPNAPISSEYFKYFELFQKRQLPPQKKQSQRKRKKSKHSGN